MGIQASGITFIRIEVSNQSFSDNVSVRKYSNAKGVWIGHLVYLVHLTQTRNAGNARHARNKTVKAVGNVYNADHSSRENASPVPSSISLRSILICGTEYSGLLGSVSVKVPRRM